MKNRLFSLAMAALLVSAAACAKSEEGAEGAATTDSTGATTEAVTPMPVDSAATMAPLSVHRRIGGTRSSMPASAQRSSASERTRLLAATPPTINTPPSNWTGPGSWSRSNQANSTANSTSVRPTNEAVVAPSVRAAITPTA